MREILTVKELAKELKVSTAFLYTKLPELYAKKRGGVYKIGKNWRVDLDKFLREG